MKSYPIRENHLFVKAYSRGKKSVEKTVVVYVLKDLHAKRLQHAHPQKKRINRVGLTVSKRIGGAVQRNRVKRIIREGLRLTQREYVLKTGFLLVIVARDAALQAKSTQIQRDLISALRRLDMLETRTENQEAQIC